jgi:hypothetical protein
MQFWSSSDVINDDKIVQDKDFSKVSNMSITRCNVMLSSSTKKESFIRVACDHHRWNQSYKRNIILNITGAETYVFNLIKESLVEFEVLTSVVMTSSDLWDVTLCSLSHPTYETDVSPGCAYCQLHTGFLLGFFLGGFPEAGGNLFLQNIS